jgi:hypothetical protein
MREAHVHRLSADAPDDTASIEAAIADGRIHGELFVSGGAEHQGPEGGGPVAIIANAAQELP